MRLIDADDLKNVFEGYSCTENRSPHFPLEMVKMDIDKAPIVDAVPVVRCKECKQWHKDIGWCDKHSHFIDSDGSFCHPWESNDWKMFNENDFCSDGERVKDECVCKKERH